MDNQNIEKFKKGKKCLITALMVILGVLLLTFIVSTAVDISNKVKEGKYIGQDIETQNKITVSATGEVYAKPDLALTTFSVVSEAKTVASAMSENTERMNGIIDSVKNQGVEEKDLKTTSFNIYPRYEWREKEECVTPCPSGRRVLVGYEVRQSLQVKIRDMLKIGEIIEGATSAGVNQVGNLQFTIDNQDELKKQARVQAIEEAKAKAAELAFQLGVDLARITNFVESSVFPRYYGLEKAIGMDVAEEAAPSPQIETGENKIEVTVTITYGIN